MNLGNNAVKYTNCGGTIRTSCVEKMSDDEKAVYVFTIKDNGIGMTEEFQKRAFEAFTQENTASPGGYSGIGLGLSITKQLVDQLGGSIQLESKKGEGTAFYVEIPFAIDHTEYDEQQAAAADNICLDGMNLLLVEDNELNREIAVFMLEEAGASVDIATNGEEAVKTFADSAVNSYDMILMDVRMPLMNGYEATKAIRSMERPDAASVMIIAMSANAFSEDIEESRMAGMNMHLAKPLNSQKLISAIYQCSAVK